MNRFIMMAALITSLAAQAQTASTAAGSMAEVLVLTTATELPRVKGRRAAEIQNLGPNAIFCAFTSAGAVVGLGRRIEPNGGVWALNATESLRIWCVSATAAQVTTAATIVTELR